MKSIFFNKRALARQYACTIQSLIQGNFSKDKNIAPIQSILHRSHLSNRKRGSNSQVETLNSQVMMMTNEKILSFIYIRRTSIIFSLKAPKRQVKS